MDIKIHSFVAAGISLCLGVLFSGLVQAASINIQNANYAQGSNKIIVKGTLSGFTGATTVGLYDADHGRLIAEESTTSNQYQFQIIDSWVPCNVQVVAGSVTTTSDLRNAPTSCGQGQEGLSWLTLSGTVLGGSIPNAIIKVTVGSHVFAGTANSKGNFRIEVATVNPDDLVVIESQGLGAKKILKMISIAGTFAGLLVDSGGDGAVDSAENPNINNTPFTTALFALMLQANGGPISTLAELQQAQKSVSTTRLLELAAVIKMVMDSPSSGLPEGYSDTLEFLTDMSVDGSGRTPVENFIVTNREAVDGAVAVIVADNALVAGFTTASVPSRYYEIRASQPGFLSSSGGVLEFGATTGALSGLTGATGNGAAYPLYRDFGWTITGGELLLTFTPSIEVEVYNFWRLEDTQACLHPDTHTTPGCTCEDYKAKWDRVSQITHPTVTITGRAYNRILDGQAVDFTRLSETMNWTFQAMPMWNADGEASEEVLQICPEVEVAVSDRELRDSGAAETALFNTDLVLGKWATQLLYDAGPGVSGDDGLALNSDIVMFTQDDCDGGWYCASGLISKLSLRWRIVDEATSGGDGEPGDLQIAYVGGPWIQTIRQLDMLGLEHGLMHFFRNSSTGERFAAYYHSVKVDEDFEFTGGYPESTVGLYWNGMINSMYREGWFTDNNGDLNIIGPFGWDFANDHTFIRLSPDFGNLDGIWELNASGACEDVTDYRTYCPGTLKMSYSYLGWTDEYDDYYNRYWTPIAATNVSFMNYVGAEPDRRRLYVLEEEFVLDDQGQRIRRFSPRINIVEEISTDVTIAPSP